VIDARHQCGPTQDARICGGGPRPIHFSEARVLEPAGAYRRKLRSVLKR
jgi:hypothetical protein